MRDEKAEKHVLKKKLANSEEYNESLSAQLEGRFIKYDSIVEELFIATEAFHRDISALSKDKSSLEQKLSEMEANYQEKIKLLDKIQEKILIKSSEVKDLKRNAKISKETISDQKTSLGQVETEKKS